MPVLSKNPKNPHIYIKIYMGVRIPTAVAQPFSLIPALVKGAAIDGKDGLHALHAHTHARLTHMSIHIRINP